MEGSAEKALLQASILIKTYWNVNMDTEGWQRSLMTILIEIYWNVKGRASNISEILSLK